MSYIAVATAHETKIRRWTTFAPPLIRNRVLHKLARELGLPKLTFQVIRRTIATLAKDKGHVKDIQGMMRHSRLATTTDVYMQSLEGGVRSTINSIHEELIGTGAWGSNRQPPAASGPSHTRQHSAGNATPAQPACGVVLEFATRMRQSRRREVLPSC